MLQAFASAGRTGNFARTATELNLTASAVSHQISGLEEWWEVRLFERHSRGVELTAAGRTLLPIVSSFFEQIEEAQALLDNPSTPPLKLYCTSSLCTAWLAPRIHAASSLSLFGRLTLLSADLKLAPQQPHDYDVAIVMGDGQFGEISASLLMRDTVLPVCSPVFLRQHPGATVAEMITMPLIHRVDDQVCPTWDDWFEYHGVDGRLRSMGPRFSDSNQAIGLAMTNGGVALGRIALVYEQLKAGTLVPLNDLVMPCPTAYYVTSKEGPMSPDVARLLQWLKAQAEQFWARVKGEFPHFCPAV